MHTSFDILEIQTFGGVIATWQQPRLAVSLSPREEALLVFLAYQNISVSRAQLCTTFWPDDEKARARGNLRKLLTDIRKSLGEFVQADRDAVWLNEGHYWLDVHEFQRHLHPVGLMRDLPNTNAESDIVHLTKAMHLYHGDFMANFKQPQSRCFAEWLEEKQQHLHQQAVLAYKRLITSHVHKGQLSQALLLSKRLLTIDPLDEETNGQLLRLLANQNQLAAALEHYQRYVQLLAEEVGSDVEPELKELYQQIQVGIIPPPAANTEIIEAKNFRQAHVSAQAVPRPLTPLIGRAILLNQIHQYLQSSTIRLITLAGLGGVGKTRVALALIDHAASCFVDGVSYIALKPAKRIAAHGAFGNGKTAGNDDDYPKDEEWLIQSTARAIGVNPDKTDFSNTNALIDHINNQLRNCNQLLIFDGFEQCIAQAPFLIRLLEDAPMVKIVVTSRQVLQLIGELVIQVEGLGFAEGLNFSQLTDADRKAIRRASQPLMFDEQIIDLWNAPCVQLFTSCAERQNPALTFTTGCIHQIAQICYLLEGNPLAIQMVAGLINHYEYGELITMLRENLQVLDVLGNGRTAATASMRTVLEESWQSLSPVEQQTLADLATLPSEFSRDKALQIKGVSPATLIDLTHKSMVRAIGHGHYHMPRIVQMFATQKQHQMGASHTFGITAKEHLNCPA